MAREVLSCFVYLSFWIGTNCRLYTNRHHTFIDISIFIFWPEPCCFAELEVTIFGHEVEGASINSTTSMHRQAPAY